MNNKAEFEALVMKNLSVQQTDKMKKQKKRIPQIISRLEQLDKVMNKLYEDYALENIEQDRYQQLSQKYSEEYTLLKKELVKIQKHLSDHENTNERAKKFIKLVEKYATLGGYIVAERTNPRRSGGQVQADVDVCENGTVPRNLDGFYDR